MKYSKVVFFLAVFGFLSISSALGQFPLLYQKNGSASSDQFGYWVAGGGDVDGDGKADFIVGAVNADPGGLTNAGSAYVYSGATGALLYQKNGSASGDNFGNSVAIIGDITGDGKAEFIVGATNADTGGLTNNGSAYVYSGATGTLLYQKNGSASLDQFGNSVGGGGDVDGDLTPDFIVGAVTADPGGLGDAGSVYVYSGATGALIYQKNGFASGDEMGQSVAIIGDVTGDGKAEFVVGADHTDPGGVFNAGSAYVFTGAAGALLYQKDGAAFQERLGWSVGGGGDIDGDTKPDFIVGTLRTAFASDTGSAYVYSGATGTLLYKKNGAAAQDAFGVTVSNAGDVNGDGRADFIVGASQADPGGLTDAGSVYVFSGATGTILCQINGGASGDAFGNSVAIVGDVNGNGKADFIVGAQTADPGGLSNAGSAYVYGAPKPVPDFPTYKRMTARR